MKLELKRIAKRNNYTIGKLYIDGVYYCDTLEPRWRDLLHLAKKVYGKTAIPEGTYQVVVTYSPKFKRMLPRLLSVPNFDGILIHRGNYPKDTAGCIIVGENKIVGQVINSTKYEVELTDLLKKQNYIIIEVK